MVEQSRSVQVPFLGWLKGKPFIVLITFFVGPLQQFEFYAGETTDLSYATVQYPSQGNGGVQPRAMIGWRCSNLPLHD